ncbi:mannose-1-phosphate guanylyltransferase/mannose-6-phosphate isomerase [Pseudomonas sp. DP-17]|uniref:mannose-1-phosphate guanylyltransferase/mannose-6-phosphate isomerase n=1 Tax=Pseudomonas sp. DP-17 TaxID=1580486 RepID=UPI001EFBB29D|nr:mannose-1-phosphate guanylyltransferase/mannose-6-phosphate isomerase [Pseudomonas sp. DP-17]MCG8910861.1 mannose-1-phosphate guanylyltransferase/mannose-6-phosphate isomerase [Pseudomonas sp. DP-17]
MQLIPTILCGGAGSRLWPVSREQHPKPFIKLADGLSLLQKAFTRASALPDVAEILTVTNRELLFKTKDEYAEQNRRALKTSFILEPFGRNTAGAIALAAQFVLDTYGDDAQLLVLPADHLILEEEAFVSAVGKAVELAAKGQIVTFGITPESPETGYGYIQATGNKVDRFVEKPNKARAEEYLAAGNYYWNSGMFCFAAKTMLQELQKYSPEILRFANLCLDSANRTESNDYRQIELGQESFQGMPEDSIDYAIIEKSDQVSVIPCSIGWRDIGSWNAMGELVSSDDNGNRIEGEALLHDAKDCYIRSSNRLIGAVGVQDLIIIDTNDALLIAERNHAQSVKEIYNRLKSSGHDAHKVHSTVARPWGTYTVLEQGSHFKIKRIVVKPQASLSLQMHHHRSEHWIVVSGMAKVVNGDMEFLVNTNESTFIPAGHRHRLENPGLIDLVMIEVQSGEYLGEDDIVRFEDIYGRA